LSELPLKGPIPYRDGIPDGLILTGNMEADLEAMADYKQGKPFWKWEMPLRAIKHHLGRLRTITLICSPESLTHVHWFGQIMRNYYGHYLQLPPERTWWLQAAWTYLRNWLRWLRKKPSLKPQTEVAIGVWI